MAIRVDPDQTVPENDNVDHDFDQTAEKCKQYRPQADC